MKIDSRQARRLLERMGLDLQAIPDVEEVIIKTQSKNIIVKDAAVSEINAQGARIFQIVSGSIEEVEREKPKFTDADILLVMQQAGVSRERAIQALSDSDGEPARAILKLTS